MTTTHEGATPDLVADLYERWSAAFAAEPEMPLDKWRAMIEEWPQVTSEPGGVDYVEVDAGGGRPMWITPKGAVEDRGILAIHGGGFVTRSMYTHRKLFGHLAKAAGVRALSVEYPRAPEHVHPAQVKDVVAAYRWLLEQGIDAGGSAGRGDKDRNALVHLAGDDVGERAGHHETLGHASSEDPDRNHRRWCTHPDRSQTTRRGREKRRKVRTANKERDCLRTLRRSRPR
jgi:hypothetical protein